MAEQATCRICVEESNFCERAHIEGQEQEISICHDCFELPWIKIVKLNGEPY